MLFQNIKGQVSGRDEVPRNELGPEYVTSQTQNLWDENVSHFTTYLVIMVTIKSSVWKKINLMLYTKVLITGAALCNAHGQCDQIFAKVGDGRLRQ